MLGTLDGDPMAGMVSPPLLGSCGVLPLTIISTYVIPLFRAERTKVICFPSFPHNRVPDIVRHLSNVIVRAKHEVFLSTNYWAAGDPAMMIANALRDLSDRVGKRGGDKVVVKIIYDRGNLKQVTRYSSQFFIFIFYSHALARNRYSTITRLYHKKRIVAKPCNSLSQKRSLTSIYK